MAVDWVRDEIILACALVQENGWRALRPPNPRVIELSGLLNRNPLHPPEQRDEKFRNPDGVARKTWDIATQHPDYSGKPTKGNRLDGEVLREFLHDPELMRGIADEIRQTIQRQDFDWTSIALALALAEDGQDEAREGRLLLARHLRRERDPRLRRRKIDSIRAQGQAIACEVCTFDFGEVYGERGREYIEVHHTLPLHVSGEVLTRLDKLVLLCANCHRMIHRRDPWLTPAELGALMRPSFAS